ncbi:uncharacterized protein LOC130724814 [Lotus japonicus]|uniref:uncharacterized protein LOC130724814 n=1 Tax=Lotus japonicus TaxID=34305 RepID=UPI002583BFDA|nr:uncharacterized protein LOC130724814 [Lotus japonicus]
MNFTNAELLKARERKMARFSPKFNNEGDGKKRGGAENQAEGAQAPKRRKLVKVSSVAGSSNPGAQPTIAAASKGKKVAKASVATATESTTVPAPNSAAAAKSTTVGATAASAGATTTSVDQSPAADTTTNISQPSAVEELVAVNATKAAASSNAPAGGKEKENETPRSPPRQDAPPSPPPTDDGRSVSPPPRREERPSPDVAATFEATQIEQALGLVAWYFSTKTLNIFPKGINGLHS